MPSHIAIALKQAIDARRKFEKYYTEAASADKGHSHYIKALQGCYAALYDPAAKPAKSEPPTASSAKTYQ